MELELLRRAAEAMTIGLVMSDATQPDNPLVYCNPAFQRLTGYRPEEIIGRNCRFMQGPDTAGPELDRLRRAIAAGESCSVVLRNYRKDRTLFWNALNVSPIRDPDGRVTHFVGVQTDITRVKELEAQLVHSQKMELVGRLTSGVAHDFNNLLTVITGFTDVALGVLEGESPARAMLGEVSAAAERAAGLTRQLLAFSHRSGAPHDRADLNAAVSGCLGMLRRLVGRAVELSVEAGAGPGAVAAEHGHIEQVLMNLVVNARDAMPDGGRVRIVTAAAPGGEAGRLGVPDGEYAVLRVSDTGCGMTPAVQSRIFEPFFTTKPVGRGTGLGLSTVADIVRRCGGAVAVESAPGRGSTFSVYLPRAAEVPALDASQSEEHRLRGTEVVLLADDDDAVRAVLCLTLRSRGYTVLDAPTAREALALAAHTPGPVDLAISDVPQVGMTAGQFFAALRADRPGLRTMAVSGYSLDPDERGGPDVPFLPKPFTPLALAIKVRQVLDAL